MMQVASQLSAHITTKELNLILRAARSNPSRDYTVLGHRNRDRQSKRLFRLHDLGDLRETILPARCPSRPMGIPGSCEAGLRDLGALASYDSSRRKCEFRRSAAANIAPKLPLQLDRSETSSREASPRLGANGVF